MQTPPRIPAAAAPLSSGVGLASWASSAEAVRKTSGDPTKSRFMAGLITDFDRGMSTEFPSFFPGKTRAGPDSVLRHAFGDSLEHGQPAKKQNPNEPARNGDVTDDKPGHGKVAAFQFRIRLDL